MKTTRLLAAGLAALLVASMPFAAGDAAEQNLPPYEITAILSLTGPVAFTGKEMQQTLLVIQDVVNKSGGIRQHPLHIDALDDQSNPQIAVQLANEVIQKHQAVMLGPAFGGTCLAVAPLLAKDGPVSYCYSPAIHPARGTFMFSSAVSIEDTDRGELRNFRERNWKRVAFLSTTDATGQTSDRAFDYYMSLPENKSLIAVAREHFAASDLTVAAQLQRIKAAQPDVIAVTASGTPFGTVLRGARDAGISVPIVANSANITYEQMKQYEQFLPATMLFGGLRGISMASTLPGPIRDAQKVYFDSFRAAGIRPDVGHALAWDATWIVVDALRHVGVSATAEQLRDYIDSLHGWVGVNGVYDFSGQEQRGIGMEGMVLIRWDASKNEFVPGSRAGGARI